MNETTLRLAICIAFCHSKKKINSFLFNNCMILPLRMRRGLNRKNSLESRYCHKIRLSFNFTKTKLIAMWLSHALSSHSLPPYSKPTSLDTWDTFSKQIPPGY